MTKCIYCGFCQEVSLAGRTAFRTGRMGLHVTPES
jgi:hypothetical protein